MTTDYKLLTNVEVVPAIIPENFSHLAEEVEKVYRLVSRVQVDIMDGKYAPVASWPFNHQEDWTFRKLITGEQHLPHAGALHYELDMMVERPEEHIDDWMNAGFKTLIVHIESTEKLSEIFDRMAERSVEVGMALKPATPLERLEPFIERAAFVQMMGNDTIGYHGVSLDSFVLPRISTLRERHPDLIIGVDIGVTAETAPILVESGANKLVSGSAIFGSDDIEETIRVFQHLGDLEKDSTV